MSHVFELTRNFRSVCTLHLPLVRSSIRIVYLAGIRKHRRLSRDLVHANGPPHGCELLRLPARFERVAAQQRWKGSVFARRQAKDYLSHFRGVAHLMSPVRFSGGNARADGRS